MTSSVERKDGNQVFRYFTERDTEYLWYDFSLSSFQIVDTVPIGADTAIIRFGGCYGDSVFGHYWPTCAFLIDYRPMMTDDEEGYFIADDIGVSNWYIGPWVSYTLVGAKVDGIIYGLFTDVDNYIDISPHSFRLDQNYPNPFNPTTKIDYSLPKSVQVKIQIYDMLGRELAVLVNEKKEQGEYSVCWNVEGIQSGVYFYRIVAGEFVETKKMVVVR